MKPQTPEEAIAYLGSLPPSTIKLGFERVDAALEALGHPERKFPALHVAGTNGKGSTCAFASAALEAAGHKVGLYTSPHLEELNERFRVGGADISDALLGQRVLEVLALIPDDSLTFFELGTVVAFHHFAQEKIDVGVIEVGLGGRLDATTRVQSTVSAITSISFDHQELLGQTLEAIAREKAGILKRGVPVVVSRQSPDALATIVACARDVGSPLYVEDRDFAAPDHVPLGLRGPHQRSNAAVAWKALELLNARGVANNDAQRAQGLASARWPGRLEQFGNVLLDGAHNPGGVAALLAALDPSVRPHLVFGVLKDKDFAPMITALFPRCASVHLTPLPSPRSWNPSEHLERIRSLCPDATVYPEPLSALAGARARGGAVLGAGSLVLIGLLRSALR